MTIENVTIEGGHVLANLEDRTITGRLIPYGEEGRTNVGRFIVEAGAIDLPADPSVVTLNVDHDRTNPVGRATRLWEQPDGVYASWSIANTPEGDQALAEATTGSRRCLSGEFGPAVIKAGKLLAGHAKLWGSAIVPKGAFPSAMVLAADTLDEEVEEVVEEAALDPDEEGNLAALSTTLPEVVTVVTPDGETAIYTPEAAPAEESIEGEIVTASRAGAVPAHLSGRLPAARTEQRPSSYRQVLAAIATLKTNPHDRDAEHVLAALTDIKISGNGALPASGVLRENWLGQLYQGEVYDREYITLGKLGTDITAQGKKGFTVHRGTSGSPIAGPQGIPNGGTWAGNKTEINSYAGRTATKESTLRRFAVGHDIAREFYDLPGGEEVVEAFLRLVVEDYLYWSDAAALWDWNTAAGAPIAPASYPTEYPAALGQLIQGILAVKKRKTDQRKDIPTFAIVNDLAYESLMYAAGGDQNLPAFVNLAISTASNGTVDGNVQVVQGDTGITGSASTIVGAGRAIEFDELAGGPLHINALELVKGGIDRATHGYLQTFEARPEAVVRIGAPDSRANETAVPAGAIIKASTTVYRVTVAGTTGSSAPSAPAVGSTVADGTATLLRLA
ncbi:HK97 family phage prohead protease [Microbacterium sp. GXF7504]